MVLVAVLLSSSICGRCDSADAAGKHDMNKVADTNAAVIKTVTLTVAEGKRLIAKGLARYASVQEKMANGTVIVCRGSSNTYVAEELLKTNLAHGAFMTGRIQPEGSAPLPVQSSIGEIVIRNGIYQPIYQPDTKFIDGLRSMQSGDIIFKGANLVNYKDRKAAVCIAHPTGGTTGLLLPFVEEQGVRLIIPVGLEKQTSQNLDELEAVTREDNLIPWLKVLPGEIFTEIEAIKQFADVEVYQLASGGISGAEGGVMLAIKGSPVEVEKALAAVAAVRGEPPF